MAVTKNIGFAWQEELANLITRPEILIDTLELWPWRKDIMQGAMNNFSLRVTKSYAARMTKRNPHDPLLRQVLPKTIETISKADYLKDPLQERAANPVPGLLHKYPNRVLVTLTSVCAIHCRYCFRRHFNYEDNNPGTLGWEKIFAYIANDKNINEVILSGGDPLIVPDKMLENFLQNLNKLKQLKRLRIHTRLPVVLPNRITSELVATLKQFNGDVIIVIHANHAQEINQEVNEALALLKKHGITLFNQTVLLKDINDNAEILAHLSESLFSAGVIPYYLHTLDKVEGIAHFDLEAKRVLQIYNALLAKLPGFLVPKLVSEQPGQLSKVILATSSFLG